MFGTYSFHVDLLVSKPSGLRHTHTWPKAPVFRAWKGPQCDIEPSVHISLDTTFHEKLRRQMEIYSSLGDAVRLLNCYVIIYLNAKCMRNDRCTIFRCVLLKVLVLGYLPFQWIFPNFLHSTFGLFQFGRGVRAQDYTSVMHYSRFSFSKEAYTQDLTETWRCFFWFVFVFFWEGKNKTMARKLLKRLKRCEKVGELGSPKNHGISKLVVWRCLETPLYTSEPSIAVILRVGKK